MNGFVVFAGADGPIPGWIWVLAVLFVAAVVGVLVVRGPRG